MAKELHPHITVRSAAEAICNLFTTALVTRHFFNSVGDKRSKKYVQNEANISDYRKTLLFLEVPESFIAEMESDVARMK